MLFFRSEDLVRKWCSDRRVTMGPVVRMDQLWKLSTTWYGNRLSPDARRPGPAEMRETFASLGLSGKFWDPEAVWE